MGRIADFIEKALTDAKTNSPSTKRLGHFIGLSIASIVSLVMLGIIVGMSVGVSPTNYQFVYSALNSTITWIIGFLVAGGSFSYVATKKTESSKDNPEGDNG